jgi:hypothetical protein
MADHPTQKASENRARAFRGNHAITTKNVGNAAEELTIKKGGIILGQRVSPRLPTNSILGFGHAHQSMNKKPVIAFAYNDVARRDLIHQDIADGNHISRPD